MYVTCLSATSFVASTRLKDPRPLPSSSLKNVILHSFFLTNFRVKQDVVPGMSIPGWFRALRPGTFPIMCAELCGDSHTTMGTFLRVLEPDAFQEWVVKSSTESVLENLGADPLDPDFDAADLDPTERPDWFGDAEAKFWWWWDSNPTRVGYAEDFSRR